MNRTLCLLCVSKFSSVSQEVVKRLTFPYDLLSVSGTTLLFLDSAQDREQFVKEFCIETLPALIVCYRGKTPQAFLSADLIVGWYEMLFAQILHAPGGEPPRPVLQLPEDRRLTATSACDTPVD